MKLRNVFFYNLLIVFHTAKNVVLNNIVFILLNILFICTVVSRELNYLFVPPCKLISQGTINLIRYYTGYPQRSCFLYIYIFFISLEHILLRLVIAGHGVSCWTYI